MFSISYKQNICYTTLPIYKNNTMYCNTFCYMHSSFVNIYVLSLCDEYVFIKIKFGNFKIWGSICTFRMKISYGKYPLSQSDEMLVVWGEIKALGKGISFGKGMCWGSRYIAGEYLKIAIPVLIN